jgi:hypothetical protein
VPNVYCILCMQSSNEILNVDLLSIHNVVSQTVICRVKDYTKKMYCG